MNNFNNGFMQNNPYSPNYQGMFQNNQNANRINWVQGIEGAKAWQMSPNSNVVLMDSENEGIFYIKISDAYGMCSLRTFEYSEKIENSKMPNENEFVTRKEFEELLRKLGEVSDDGK